MPADPWTAGVTSRLTARGWRAAWAPRGFPMLTATHPTRSGLVVVVHGTQHIAHDPHVRSLKIEIGVGAEPAMDLAAYLGWLPRSGAWFPSDPDRLPPGRSVRHGDDEAVADLVVAEADRALSHLADRFDGLAGLEEGMAAQIRLLHTDLVLERVVLLSATGRTDDALVLLHDTVARLDDAERHDRGWRPMAERLEERLLAWIDDGRPPPPSWAAP